MKLNNRGYLLVEIIVCSVITMVIAYFLLDLTISFKDKSEIAYYQNKFASAKTLITKNVMDDIEKNSLKKIEFEENSATGQYGVIFRYKTSDLTTDLVKKLTLSKKNNNTVEYKYGVFKDGKYDTNEYYFYKELEGINIVSMDIDNKSYGDTQLVTDSIMTITFNAKNVFVKEDYKINIVIPYNSLETDTIPILNVKIDNNDYGNIKTTISGTSNNGPYTGMVNYKTPVTVSQTEKSGYKFVGWYEGSIIKSTSSTYSFEMPTYDFTLTAKYSFDIDRIVNVRVLNVYPDIGNNLETWMETNGYGQGKINVDQVSITNFNANPTTYLGTSGNWKYDVIVFGFWDCNNSLDLVSNSANLVKSFLLQNNPVVFGHDTMIYIPTDDAIKHTYFKELSQYAGLTLDSIWESNVDTKVIITQTSLFTSYPHDIGGVGTVLTVPPTHNVGQNVVSTNNVLLKFNNDVVSSIKNHYLMVYNNTAMIQTGHSNGSATKHEQMILANLIFYLYSQKQMYG